MDMVVVITFMVRVWVTPTFNAVVVLAWGVAFMVAFMVPVAVAVAETDAMSTPHEANHSPLARTLARTHERKPSSELVRRPVVALGYQAPDGTIVVTDVLCMNFPDMTNEKMAALSWKLDQWSREPEIPRQFKPNP